jgi:hypothetical protein
VVSVKLTRLGRLLLLFRIQREKLNYNTAASATRYWQALFCSVVFGLVHMWYRTPHLVFGPGGRKVLLAGAPPLCTPEQLSVENLEVLQASGKAHIETPYHRITKQP